MVQSGSQERVQFLVVHGKELLLGHIESWSQHRGLSESGVAGLKSCTGLDQTLRETAR